VTEDSKKPPEKRLCFQRTVGPVLRRWDDRLGFQVLVVAVVVEEATTSLPLDFQPIYDFRLPFDEKTNEVISERASAW
jgi:hypothetical protein